jgi:hypothetical protein
MPMSVIASDELKFRITTATEYKDGEKFKVINLCMTGKKYHIKIT